MSAVGIVAGGGVYLFGDILLRIYNNDPQVIHYGMIRLSYVCLPYFLCGLMDTMVGGIRGLGVSVLPMIVSLVGACGLRIVWIYTIFQWNRSLDVLFLSYPITWAITTSVHVICFFIVRKRVCKN